MRLNRWGAKRDHGTVTVTYGELSNSGKWDKEKGECCFYTGASKDPVTNSNYHHELRLSLEDILALLKMVSNDGILHNPDKVRDMLKIKGGVTAVESLIKLLCCTIGYIPTTLPGAVAVKS